MYSSWALTFVIFVIVNSIDYNNSKEVKRMVLLNEFAIVMLFMLANLFFTNKPTTIE